MFLKGELIMYEFGKVKKVLGNKIAITIYD
jgi:hypothetical protein